MAVQSDTGLIMIGDSRLLQHLAYLIQSGADLLGAPAVMSLDGGRRYVGSSQRAQDLAVAFVADVSEGIQYVNDDGECVSVLDEGCDIIRECAFDGFSRAVRACK